MPKRKSPPRYCRHTSGQARVRVDGKVIYLGKYGSPESKEQYSEIIEEWSQRQDAPASLSVKELVLLYMRHADQHYRKNGEPTSELSCVKIALRPVVAQFGEIEAHKFTPKMFKAVRERMIDAAYVRTSINQHVGRIKRMFKWAVSEDLLSVEPYQALCTVAGLQKGRTRAIESEPVKPVSEQDIDAILPHVTRPVRGLVQIQRHTGMRPGEALQLRGCDLIRGNEVWEFTPHSHKTEHHDRERIVMIGPKGQAVLHQYLKENPEAYLFSPRDASRIKKGPRLPGERYTTSSYNRAIAKACKRAGIPKWKPNQLRHAAATRVRRESDIETARTVLGQSSIAVAEIYAEQDRERARRIMRQVG